MTPVKFPGSNIVFGEGQPEYQPLPALKLPNGEVITCWEMSDEELAQVVNSRRIYFKQLTFNGPLQPILPLACLSDDIGFIDVSPTP